MARADNGPLRRSGSRVGFGRGAIEAQRFYIALCLASVPSFGFLLALFSNRLYGGSLSDPTGIPRARIPILGKTHSVDLNVVTILAALGSLAVIGELYWH
jgi:hypothetical protein